MFFKEQTINILFYCTFSDLTQLIASHVYCSMVPKKSHFLVQKESVLLSSIRLIHELTSTYSNLHNFGRICSFCPWATGLIYVLASTITVHLPVSITFKEPGWTYRRKTMKNKWPDQDRETNLYLHRLNPVVRCGFQCVSKCTLLKVFRLCWPPWHRVLRAAENHPCIMHLLHST